MLIQPIAPNMAIAFGLEWETLIGNKLDAQSFKRATLRKAAQYVKASEHSIAAGFANISKADNPNNLKLYSAAAIFAQLNSNGIFYELKELPNGATWVVAAQDGTVIAGTDKICTPQDAQALIAHLVERYPQIIKQTSDEHDYTFHLNSQTQLYEVKSAIEAVPSHAKALIIIVLMIVLGNMLWGRYEADMRSKTRARVAAPINPTALWKESIDQWQKDVHLGGRESLWIAFDNLLALPITIGNWELSEAGCTASPSGWACDAHLKRLPTGTNNSLKEAVPAHWHIAWNGLNGAIARWSIPFTGKTLERSRLPTLEDMSVAYVSDLQDVLPAFHSYTLSPPEKAPVPPPKVATATGKTQAVPYPRGNAADIQIPSIQRFQLEAPLRSITVLPLMDNFDIKTFRVEFVWPLDKPGLSRSALTAKLTGEFYAK